MQSKMAVLLLFWLSFASIAAAEDGTQPTEAPPPANGSSDRGGTSYHPVYDTGSGSSVGVIVTPNPGTPQSAPSSSYGVGVQVPLPERK